MAVVLLAISISLDSLGIGVGYGLKKVRISFTSLGLIVAMTLGVLTLTYAAGNLLSSAITPDASRFLGASLMILLGLYFLIRAYPESQTPVCNFIGILRKPDSGDIDNSGNIDGKEALFVGAALAADAAAIGFASAAYAMNFPLFLIITAVINFSMLRLGEIIGRKTGRLIPEKHLKSLSGLLVLCLGIARLF
jgi:putative sporulation protein YtaF